MAFLPGDQRDLGSCTAAQVEQLGSLLGSLHRQPAGTLAQSLEATADLASYAHERWHSILAGLVWVRDPLPTGIQERLNGSAASMLTRWETTRNAAWFETDETLALLHGDVGPGNLLWGPNPALIDWEYARLGDPADEIAYTLDQNGLTASQRHAFWSGYRQHEADQARLDQIARRVDWWERLTLLGSALWWAERFVRRAETDTNAAPDPAVPRALSYYLEQLTRRTQRLHDSLR